MPNDDAKRLAELLEAKRRREEAKAKPPTSFLNAPVTSSPTAKAIGDSNASVLSSIVAKKQAPQLPAAPKKKTPSVGMGDVRMAEKRDQEESAFQESLKSMQMAGSPESIRRGDKKLQATATADVTKLAGQTAATGLMGIVPALGGMAGAGAGAAAGMLGGPLAPITSPLGAILGAMKGGELAGQGQDALLKRTLKPKDYTDLQGDLQSYRERNPTGAMAVGALPQLLMQNPSALASFGERTVGAGLGAGLSAAQQKMAGQPLDINEIIGQGALGALQAGPNTRFGTVAESLGTNAVRPVGKRVAALQRSFGENVAVNRAINQSEIQPGQLDAPVPQRTIVDNGSTPSPLVPKKVIIPRPDGTISDAAPRDGSYFPQEQGAATPITAPAVRPKSVTITKGVEWPNGEIVNPQTTVDDVPLSDLRRDPLSGKNLWEMNQSEIDAALANETQKAKQIEESILGSNLARWKRAWNISNGTDFKAAKAADEEIAAIEAGLSPEDLKKLYGEGEAGISPDELKDWAQSFRNISDSADANELGQSIAKNLLILKGETDQSAMTPRQQRALAEVQHATKVAQENGFDPQGVLKSAIDEAQRQSGDSRTGDELLGSYAAKLFDTTAPKTSPIDNSRPTEGNQGFSAIGIKDRDSLHRALTDTHDGLTPDQVSALADHFDDFAHGVAEKQGIPVEDVYKDWAGITRADDTTLREVFGGTGKEQGAMQVTPEDGRLVLAAFDRHNVSTPLHEFSHIFLNKFTKAEQDAILAALGSARDENGNIPANAHEQFASGYEAAILRGKVGEFSPAIQKAFNQFRGWLLELYRGLKRIPKAADGLPKVTTSWKDGKGWHTQYSTGLPPEALSTIESYLIAGKARKDAIANGEPTTKPGEVNQGSATGARTEADRGGVQTAQTEAPTIQQSTVGDGAARRPGLSGEPTAMGGVEPNANGVLENAPKTKATEATTQSGTGEGSGVPTPRPRRTTKAKTGKETVAQDGGLATNKEAVVENPTVTNPIGNQDAPYVISRRGNEFAVDTRSPGGKKSTVDMFPSMAEAKKEADRLNSGREKTETPRALQRGEPDELLGKNAAGEDVYIDEDGRRTITTPGGMKSTEGMQYRGKPESERIERYRIAEKATPPTEPDILFQRSPQEDVTLGNGRSYNLSDMAAFHEAITGKNDFENPYERASWDEHVKKALEPETYNESVAAINRLMNTDIDKVGTLDFDQRIAAQDMLNDAANDFLDTGNEASLDTYTKLALRVAKSASETGKALGSMAHNRDKFDPATVGLDVAKAVNEVKKSLKGVASERDAQAEELLKKVLPEHLELAERARNERDALRAEAESAALENEIADKEAALRANGDAPDAPNPEAVRIDTAIKAAMGEANKAKFSLANLKGIAKGKNNTGAFLMEQGRRIGLEKQLAEAQKQIDALRNKKAEVESKAPEASPEVKALQDEVAALKDQLSANQGKAKKARDSQGKSKSRRIATPDEKRVFAKPESLKADLFDSGMLFQRAPEPEPTPTDRYFTAKRDKLVELAGGIAEDGNRSWPDWSAAMKKFMADGNGPELTEAQLQQLWVDAKSQGMSRKGTGTKRTSIKPLIDEAIKSLGINGAKKFLDDISTTDGRPLLLEKIIAGEALDGAEKSLLAKAWAAASPQRGKGTPRVSNPIFAEIRKLASEKPDASKPLTEAEITERLKGGVKSLEEAWNNALKVSTRDAASARAVITRFNALGRRLQREVGALVSQDEASAIIKTAADEIKGAIGNKAKVDSALAKMRQSMTLAAGRDPNVRYRFNGMTDEQVKAKADDKLSVLGRARQTKKTVNNPLIDAGVAEYYKKSGDLDQWAKSVEKRVGKALTDDQKAQLFMDAARLAKQQEIPIEQIKRDMNRRLEEEVYAAMPRGIKKAGIFVNELVNLHQGFQASFDMSFWRRQGGIVTMSNPKIMLQAVKEAFQSLKTGNGENVEARLKADMEAEAMLYGDKDYFDKIGYEFTKGVEEGFYATSGAVKGLGNLAEHGFDFKNRKIKTEGDAGLMGKSERANRILINRVRLELFKQMTTSKEGGRKVSDHEFLKAWKEKHERLLKDGNTEAARVVEHDIEMLQKTHELLASYSNVATGRADVRSQSGQAALNAAAKTLFWSPRLNVSRIQHLLGWPMARALKHAIANKDSRAAKIIGKEYLKYTAMKAITTILISAIPGVSIMNSDEKETDWMKFKAGDLEDDSSEGQRKHVVFWSRILTNMAGAAYNTVTGKAQDGSYTPGAYVPDASFVDGVKLLANYMRSMDRPIVGLIHDLVIKRGIGPDGKPMTPGSIALGLGLPLPVGNTVKAMAEQKENRGYIDPLVTMGSVILDVIGESPSVRQRDVDYRKNWEKKHPVEKGLGIAAPDQATERLKKEAIKAHMEWFADGKTVSPDMAKSERRAFSGDIRDYGVDALVSLIADKRKDAGTKPPRNIPRAISQGVKAPMLRMLGGEK